MDQSKDQQKQEAVKRNLVTGDTTFYSPIYKYNTITCMYILYVRIYIYICQRPWFVPPPTDKKQQYVDLLVGAQNVTIRWWWEIAKNIANLSYPEKQQMGVSENSVPLNPMVNDHYPY